MLTRASFLSPANRRSEVPLLSLTRVSLHYAPITLQSSSPVRTPVLAFANISKSKAYIIFLWECRNVASRDDIFAIFLQEVEAKVVHLTVEAFVLSGSNALRAMPHNLSWGLASARRRRHSVHQGQAHFLVLG